MSEMIERVAAIIATSGGFDGPAARVFESDRQLARQIIAAMREPTEAMAMAGVTTQLVRSDVPYHGSDWAQQHWMGQSYTAMIDAALSPPPESGG